MVAEKKYQGGCVCGDIRFEVDSSQAISAYHCHCKDCQKATGSGYAAVLFLPKQALDIQQGEAKFYATTGESGGTVNRGFCANCGGPVFSYLSKAPDIAAIRIGALDDSDWVKTKAAVWCVSATSWAPPYEGVPHLEKQG